MRGRTSLLCSTMCLLAMAGCGVPSPEELQSQAGVALCQYQVRCGQLAPSLEKQCEANLNNSLKNYPQPYDLSAAVNAGRVNYDSAKGQSCLDSIKSASCSGSGQLPACQATFTGKVAVGGMCLSSLECAGGACNSTTEGCPGTCVAFLATGAACGTSASQCATTDTCDFSTHTCTTIVPQGGACTSSAQCALSSCVTSGSSMVCGNVLTAGQPCTTQFYGDDPCIAGLYCDGSVCTAQLGSGAACSDITACQDGLSCTGLFFNDTNGSITVMQKGACAPFLENGAACDPTVSVTGCTRSSPCDSTSKTCVYALLTLGAACGGTVMTQCDGSASLYCDTTSMTCQPQVPLGGACVNGQYNPCQAGSCGGNLCTLGCM